MQVADLANVFPTETMVAGTVLFEQGGTDGDGFIVQVGKVELSREVRRFGPARDLRGGPVKSSGSTRPCSRMTRAILPDRSSRNRGSPVTEHVLKDRIAASDPFIIYCVRNWPNFGDRLIG